MWLEAHYHEAEKLRGRPLGKYFLFKREKNHSVKSVLKFL